MGTGQDDQTPEDRTRDASGQAYGSPPRLNVGVRTAESRPAPPPQREAEETVEDLAARRYYNTVREGPRFYVIEHVPSLSGGRRLFTAESVEQAVQFLLHKACVDGLVPFDVAYERLAETLIEEHSYRDAGFAYSIVAMAGPAAYNI